MKDRIKGRGIRSLREKGIGWAAGAVLIACAGSVPFGAAGAGDGPSVAPAPREAAQPTLDEVRLVMDKWIETQQIISKERKEWQQGKDILQGRLELVKVERETLAKKIAEAQTGVAETDKKRNELLAQSRELEQAGGQLTEAVTKMEARTRQLFQQLPEPVQTRLQPLYQRIPEKPENARVSVAERFQNILGIINEVNKANNEISVSYEVHNLANGKPAEVQAIYVGLAQAYYVSARGEAGVGRPADDGWKWQPVEAAGPAIVKALEILQGKQPPAFVPLPVEQK